MEVVVGEGTLEEEEVSETKVSKEDVVVVEEEEEEVMVEVSFLVDQRAQTHGVEEKVTKEFLKMEEAVEEEEEDVVGLAVVLHLDFAFSSASMRVVLSFVLHLFSFALLLEFS